MGAPSTCHVEEIGFISLRKKLEFGRERETPEGSNKSVDYGSTNGRIYRKIDGKTPKKWQNARLIYLNNPKDNECYYG
jgi:hypothetical protein